MPDSVTPLAVPELGPVYSGMLPWIEAFVRFVAGIALVPHGLRAIFGMFAEPGRPFGITKTAGMLHSRGFRPGRIWIWGLIFAQFVAGPMLAFGLFTRPAALICVVFLLVIAIERARANGYFWNTQGAEYPLVWATLCFYFVFRGGGPYSIDTLLIGYAF